MDSAEFQRRIGATDWSSTSTTDEARRAIVAQLIAAACGDELAAGEALGELLGQFCHQGVLEPEAPEIARWLLGGTEIADQPHPWMLLATVEYLVSCAWVRPREFGFPPRRASFQGAVPPRGLDGIRSQAAYDDLSSKLHRSLEEAVPSLLSLLAHPDPRTRALAVRLLACCRGASDRIGSALRAALEGEEDGSVRAGLLLALAWEAVRAGAPGVVPLARARQALSSADVFEQMAALVALLLLEPRPCLRGQEPLIRRGLRFAEQVDVLLFPWAQGQVVDLVAAALARADAPDEPILELLLDAVEHWAATPAEPAEWREQDVLLARLVPRAFPGAVGRREYLERGDLSPVQRSLVARLARYSPPALKGYAPASVGLRNLWRDADRLLGLSTGGLDRRMEGSWDGHAVEWPLWKWWHQASLADRWVGGPQAHAARDFVLDTMERALPPEAIFGAAEDAVAGAYDVPHAPLVRRVAALADGVVERLSAYVGGLGEPSGAQAALAVVPSLALAARGTVPWLDRILPWVERVAPAELHAQAQAMAGALPPGSSQR